MPSAVLIGRETGRYLVNIGRLAEEVGRRETYDAAKARIEKIEKTRGIAAPRGSTAPPPSVAAKNAHPSVIGESIKTGLSTVPGIGPFVQAGQSLLHTGEVVGGEAGKALESAGTSGSGALVAGVIAEPLAKGLVGLVEPVALKLVLYAVFIFGGVALAGYGLATMLKPNPPSVTGGIKKLGKTAAVAAAA